jgi:hypothetical protein
VNVGEGMSGGGQLQAEIVYEMSGPRTVYGHHKGVNIINYNLSCG